MRFSHVLADDRQHVVRELRLAAQVVVEHSEVDFVDLAARLRDGIEEVRLADMAEHLLAEDAAAAREPERERPAGADAF